MKLVFRESGKVTFGEFDKSCYTDGHDVPCIYIGSQIVALGHNNMLNLKEEKEYIIEIKEASEDTKLYKPISGSEKNPRVGCAAILLKDTNILLGKRNKDPERGKWVLVGGKVEPFEPLELTLKREVREEVGIEIDQLKLYNVYEIVNPPNEHRIIIYWTANYLSGEIRPSSDISEARFFSIYDLFNMIDDEVTINMQLKLNMTETTKKVLTDFVIDFVINSLRKSDRYGLLK
jgi:ADP-ribose pyrophosphatase YjhB (NUDIX family)